MRPYQKVTDAELIERERLRGERAPKRCWTREDGGRNRYSDPHHPWIVVGTTLGDLGNSHDACWKALKATGLELVGGRDIKVLADKESHLAVLHDLVDRVLRGAGITVERTPSY